MQMLALIKMGHGSRSIYSVKEWSGESSAVKLYWTRCVADAPCSYVLLGNKDE